LNGTLDQQGRSKILVTSNITAMQIGESLLAIPAFLPATVCTGYVVGWFTNLHDFRQRSLVERIFWSLPLSVALSTISAVLIGKFLSLSAVVVFYAAASVLFLAILAREGFRLRRSR
jgi:ABC-type multidrug transport system permease subunit